MTQLCTDGSMGKQIIQTRKMVGQEGKTSTCQSTVGRSYMSCDREAAYKGQRLQDSTSTGCLEDSDS